MERMGEYLVKRLVGEGGMGKVYEAEERLSKRRVALKVLRSELTRTEEGRRLFLGEMQILACLEHPNVVRSLASMEEDGHLCLVLEYVDGRTLRDELTERGRFPWPEAVEIAAQMAQGLAAAHGQAPPIVHRDLKPENVMLPVGFAEGAPLKVMDFGIAKVLEKAQGRTATASIGTLQYMSPEQIDATALDGRSDLYALGLVLYEMLSGAPPFQSASPRELLNLQCTAEPPALPDDVLATLPRGVEDLLLSLLEKKAEDRPASADAVLQALSAFRAGASPKRARRSDKEATSARKGAAPASADAREDRDAGAPARTTGSGVRSVRTGDTLPSNPQPRADTVALVARASAPREVPTWAGVAAVVVLSLAAGIATYAVRASADAAELPRPEATAQASPKAR